jgi:hypothetical protein
VSREAATQSWVGLNPGTSVASGVLIERECVTRVRRVFGGGEYEGFCGCSERGRTEAASWASGDVGDVRAWVIGDTTPLTADRRVETSGSGRGRMAWSGRPAPPRSEDGDDDQRADATMRTPREVAEG